MAKPLFSDSWYRVAALLPRLRSHTRVHRHDYRGQLWYVIQDHSSGRHHRLSPSAYAIVGLMDGARSVQQIWTAATNRLGERAPTQDETIKLLGMLHAADLLQCDATPDSLELFRRFQRHQQTKLKRSLLNPMSMRFPLFDPDRFLTRTLPFVRPLFSRWALLAWLAVVASGAALAGAHWPELTDDLAERAFAPQSMLLLGLTFPLLKGLHELGHAYATKVWGGEVHEMGIMLLVLMPVPYVDASASSAFPDKRRRVAVSAAGIVVEVFLACLALFAWLSVEPGLVRDLLYNLVLIGGASTILFNGNPLLRFDGYYVLADAIEIPNLAARSTQHIGYLIQRHLFGVQEAQSPATSLGERRWFVAYAVAAFVYRAFVMVAIALFIGSRFLAVGALLAIWFTASQLVAPALRHLAFVFQSPRLQRTRARAVTATAAIAAGLALFLFLLPLPLRTRAEGVVWMPEQAQVRAGAEGFVTRILVAPESAVRSGEPLIEVEDPLLEAQLRVVEARWRELDARYRAAWYADPVQAGIVKEELVAAEADLVRARERVREVVILSPSDGTFVVPGAQDLLGRFVHQGELVGYVIDPARATVRVAVPQSDVGLIRQRTRGVEVRLADRLAEALPASIQREAPAATNRLPSPALGRNGGGPFALDPEDTDGTLARDKLFQFDIELPPRALPEYAGGRVYVRFHHGTEPLAQRSFRSLRRLFLRQFGV